MKTFSIPIEVCSINFDPLTHNKDIAGDKTLSLREDFKNLSGMSCTVNLFVLLHQRVGSFVATSKFQNQLEELPMNYSETFFCGLGLSSIQKGVQHWSWFPFNKIKRVQWEHLIVNVGDFPGGPVVKNPPCNEEDMGLIPGQETKVSHAAEHLSPHAPELVSCNYQSQHATTRKFVYCSERSHMLQLRHKTAK